MKVPGRDDAKVNIFELVIRWLQDESHGIWLLVLDNLDDISIVSKSPEATPRRTFLLSYLPQSANGTILVTTRTSGVAVKIVEARDVIAVSPMTNVDATILLKKKLDKPADDHDLEELARALEYMPLAIVQAAAYIREKGARCSVREYIERFQRSEKHKTSLLNYEAGNLRRDPEAQNSVIVTWQISFDDIREKWPVAADLLSLMSYFDRQGIPEEVLRVQPGEDDRYEVTQQDDSTRDDEKDETEDVESDSAFETSDDDMFEEAVERLTSYSFVSMSEDGHTFGMHGLVQLATLKWLDIHGEEEKWKAQFLRKLNALYPNGEYENWGLCKILFPHAKAAERHQPAEIQSIREWARILRRAAWYTYARGDSREAERMCEKSVGALEIALGRKDVDILSSLSQLASIYGSQGRWTEKEKIEIEVLETQHRVLGEEHPDTLTSMNNLALTYRYQGRWIEAEKIQEEVLETQQRVVGREHPITLTSMNNLASTYGTQGRWTEAENIQKEVLEIGRRVQGDEHPDTLQSMNNLASTYWSQGRLAEAEKIEIEVLGTRRRVLGREHPDILMSMSNLALTYHYQGRLAEAEKIQEEVLETRWRVLGREHPDTLKSMHNLACTLEAQGRRKDAIELMTESVRLRNKILGTEHPDTLKSAAWLAHWNDEEADRVDEEADRVDEEADRVDEEADQVDEEADWDDKTASSGFRKRLKRRCKLFISRHRRHS
jgi:tetratricopeptide (TPR) repeat protein